MNTQIPINRRTPARACVRLPGFNTADLAAVQQAFRGAQPVALAQAWQDAPSAKFAPAVVRAGWQHDVVQIYAELTDADIFTQASGLTQRTWELGDAFEIFLRPEGQEAYVEFQVTPNNQRLQLCYANIAALERARQTGNLAEALIPGEAFRSKTWIDDKSSCWHVFAEIPADVVCGSNEPLAGSRWHFSFSRYDYTRGTAVPVISSMSPHAEANFHSQKEWGVIQFEHRPGRGIDACVADRLKHLKDESWKT